MQFTHVLTLAVPVAVAAIALAAPLATERGVPPRTPPSAKGGESQALGSISKKEWGEVDGRPVYLWTMRNGKGLEAEITNYGTIIVSLKVPDNRGVAADIVLGRPSLKDYIERTQYFGCTAGRCANRIAGGKFTLDGKEYTLATNNGPNHLHGGVKGFDKVVWEGEPRMTATGPSIIFTYLSADGEEGYPGNVSAKVTYTLTNANELAVEMTATTDAPTVVNLAHHSYWNLAGQGSGDILGHMLQIPAKNYTPVDATLITTGEIAPVANTPLDFTIMKEIGKDFAKMAPTAKDDPGGYDHNFVLDKAPKNDALWLSAIVHEPKSGRTMEVWSNQPGIQFYTGNFLDGIPGKGGTVYNKNGALCLETQAFPDSINKRDADGKPKDGWPNVVLRPGEVYSHKMVHKFTAAK